MSDASAPSVTSAMRARVDLGYNRALERVMGLADFERATHSPNHASFHLERMSALMGHLGNPHLEVPTIHIAGTKGKGSTAAMVTSILAAQDYKVGLYTSPHLHSASERIRIGLEPVSKAEFAALVDQVWPAVEMVGEEAGHGGVTTFEMLTAMAFLHFQQVGVDFQIVEVGLGGRLDSTNIVMPAVCAITSISLDHVKTLGNTVHQIAFEKAGIIKRGVRVVVAPQPSAALAVFKEVAQEKGAKVVQVGDELTWRGDWADLDGQSFEVEGLRDSYSVWLPLLGDHQLENASAAIAIVECLVDQGFAISKASILRGLREVKWPARLEVVSRAGPLVVVDGAHNPYSMRRLAEAIRRYFQYRRLFLIFGALGGHSAEGMVAEMADLSPSILAVCSRHPRSAPSVVIADLACRSALPVVYESDDIGAATRQAMEMARPDDLVLGAGSLSVAAEIIEELRGMAPELYPNITRPSYSAPASRG